MKKIVKTLVVAAAFAAGAAFAHEDDDNVTSVEVSAVRSARSRGAPGRH